MIDEAVDLLCSSLKATQMLQRLSRHWWELFPLPPYLETRIPSGWSPEVLSSRIPGFSWLPLRSQPQTQPAPRRDSLHSNTKPHVSPPKHADPLDMSQYYTFLIYFLWFRTSLCRFMNTRGGDPFSPNSALFNLAIPGLSFYSSGYSYDIKSLKSWVASFGAWHLVHVKWSGFNISFP